MANAKLIMNLETGHFIVSSTENINDFDPLFLEDHYFQSEWDYNNNLIRFQMDDQDAFGYLEDIESPYYEISNYAKSNHFSIMRYERL